MFTPTRTIPTVITPALLLALLLTACGGSEPDPTPTPTTAPPTATATVTLTPTPTSPPTPRPTATPGPTATPTTSVADVRTQVLDFLTQPDLLPSYDLDAIQVARFIEGTLEIELRTKWASRDRQPPISYAYTGLVAALFETWTPETAAILAGGEFRLLLRTYSTDGRYTYESTSDLATLQAVARKTMTYDEWVAASGAGFLN